VIIKGTLLYNNAKFIFLVIAPLFLNYTHTSDTGFNTAKVQQNVTDNDNVKVPNSLTYYPSPHPERNLKIAHSLQVELAEITTICPTRATVNLTYSCNNFLIYYQSVLNNFFHSNTTLTALRTLSLGELENKVDAMLVNCNAVDCYYKVGLLNTKITQLFIEKAEDLLVITGQMTVLNRLPSA